VTVILSNGVTLSDGPIV